MFRELLTNRGNDDGIKYSSLNSEEIDKFCAMMKGDKDSQKLGEIYESKVPRIYFDVEAIVKGMRSKYTGGL